MRVVLFFGLTLIALHHDPYPRADALVDEFWLGELVDRSVLSSLGCIYLPRDRAGMGGAYVPSGRSCDAIVIAGESTLRRLERFL